MTMIFAICVVGLSACLVLAWKKPAWAMSLLILTAGVPVITGIVLIEQETEPLGPVVLFIGLLNFLLTVLVIYLKPQPQLDKDPWPKTVSRECIKIVLAILFSILFLAVLQWYGLIMIILAVIFVIRYKQTRRYSMALNVLATLAGAMRQNLPLPMALETAAQNRKDPASPIYRRTALYLCSGHSLTESLQKAYPDCPAEILASIAAAENMNQLPQALAAVERDSSANINDLEKVRPVHPAYPLIVGAVMLLIVLGLSVFILPTFAEVLSDMSDGGFALPPSTQLLLNMTAAVTHPKHLLFLLLIVLILVPLGLYAHNRPRRPQSPRLLSRLGDRLKWHLPLMHHFEYLRSLQRTIQCLRTGLTAGFSFDVIVRQALNLDINFCFRSQLRRWLGFIEAGRPIADSAAACGLGTTLAWALDEKVNSTNTPDLLAMLEEVYRNRYHYRLNIFHSVVWPFVIVGMGSMVGFIIFSMFAAMVNMLNVTMTWSLP